MKKILMTSCAVAMLFGASHAKAEAFNGWGLGAFLGWQRTHVNVPFNLTNAKTSLNLNGFPVGLFANWSKSNPCALYGGFEVALGYGGVNKSSNLFSGPAPTGYTFTGGGDATIDYKLKRKFFVEFTPKLGWNFGNQIVYALLSLRGTQVDHEFNSNKEVKKGTNTIIASGKSSASDFLLAVAPGVGFEHKFNANVTGGLEYRYVIEQSKEALASKVNLKIRSHDVRLRLAYTF